MFQLREYRGLQNLSALIALVMLDGCGPPAAYIAPPSPGTTTFSREFNASFDQTWSAVTYVAGSTFFNIKNFDKGSGLLTLEYSNLRGGPGPFVTCGTVSGGFSNVTITPEPNSVLNHVLGMSRLTLSGQANITVRSSGSRRTTVQVNSLIYAVSI